MEAASKDRLGQKWTCFSCSSRFYDLNRVEPTCPRCGADQREAPRVEEPKGRGKKAVARAVPAPEPEPPRRPARRRDTGLRVADEEDEELDGDDLEGDGEFDDDFEDEDDDLNLSDIEGSDGADDAEDDEED